MNGDLSSKPEILVYAGLERRLYQSLERLAAADPWRGDRIRHKLGRVVDDL